MTEGRDRDESDERIERLERELEERTRDLYTDPPDPGPIPEVLQRPTPRPEPPGRPMAGVAGMAKAWAIALDFVFTILAGAGIGWLIDRWRGSSPIGLLVGLVLGFVVAFWRIIRTTQRQEREEARRRDSGGS